MSELKDSLCLGIIIYFTGTVCDISIYQILASCNWDFRQHNKNNNNNIKTGSHLRGVLLIGYNLYIQETISLKFCIINHILLGYPESKISELKESLLNVGFDSWKTVIGTEGVTMFT